jgi:predicted O-methyltransferase YrrM
MATALRPNFKKRRKKSRTNDLAALDFIDSIESPWKGHEKFAFWLIQRLCPKVVVDLGFDHGLSTVAFGYKNTGHVYGVDWFYEEGSYAEKSFVLDSAFHDISQAIRFNFIKNVHLIIGPNADVLKKWNRKIDLLHIDGAKTYLDVKIRYEAWQKHLKDDAVVLIHKVLSHPDEVGRFFNELPFHKCLLPHAKGLGVISTNKELIDEIKTP